MNDRGASITGETLLDGLARLPRPARYWIGFSGGADSTALLQALYEVRDRLPAPLHAVHFDHGLQVEAGDWQRHCRSFCESRAIPFHAESLEIRRTERTSLEEEARNSRYRAVEAILGEREMYLTAHHAEDQAETLFLNPRHPYTVGLMESIPVLGRKEKVHRLPTISGVVPSLFNLPEGCLFSDRCPDVFADCRQTRPHRCDVGNNHIVRCLKYA